MPLKSINHLLLLILSIFFSSAAQAELARDGEVTFYMSHEDELLTIRYADENGKWLPGAAERIETLLRSRQDQQKHEIDPRLIETADHLQDYFQAEVIEVISGFRSPEFNRSLKTTGHNVANESFHTHGKAMDIHIDEITETAIRDYLLSLKLGGVGYYGNKLMVHMDFGPVRQWQDGDFFENTTIGIFNKSEARQLTTNRLKYGLDDKLRLQPSTQLGAVKLTLEHFYRGQWKSLQAVVAPGLAEGKPETLKITDLVGQTGLPPYGKYRLRLALGASSWQNSNEFYVKKL